MLLPEVRKRSDYANEYTALLKSLHKGHQILTAIYLPLVITTMGLSCYFGYIHGAASKYTDPGEDWEACYIVGNAIHVPLQPIFDDIAGTVVPAFNCTVNGVGDPPCSSDCTLTIAATCIAPLLENGSILPENAPPISVPVGALLESLTYSNTFCFFASLLLIFRLCLVGFQAVIFSLISHGALNRALRHPSWLPATISLVVYCCFAVMTYYTINPFLPVPAKTNATLLTLMDYFRKPVFDDIPASDGSTGHCDKAFNVAWGYMGVILAVVLNMFLSLGLAIRAEIARHSSPYKKTIQHLEGTAAPVLCCSLAVVFYIIIVICKVQTSFVALHSIRSHDTTPQEAYDKGERQWFDDYFFPFQKGALDITTILFVSTFMSTIRGYSRQSVSAFRLAAGTSFAFAVTSYPGYVAAYRFYDYNNFKDDDDCKDYFLSPQVTPLFGYPSPDDAETYCQSFKWSLGAATGVLIVMHAMMLVAGRTYSDNMHRASAIFEPLEPNLNANQEVAASEERQSMEVKKKQDSIGGETF